MRSIAKLFGRSPFVPLQTHMEKVAACVSLTRDLFEALISKDQDRIESLTEQISQLEHEADEIKNDIQNQMPRGLFMAVDRARLVLILNRQDEIADRVENIGVLMTIKTLPVPESLPEPLRMFVEKNLECFAGACRIMAELDELLETGFGGVEAQRVLQQIRQVAQLEHEADRIQHDLLKVLFAHESELTHGEFYLWARILKQTGELANISDELAEQVRNLLELK